MDLFRFTNTEDLGRTLYFQIINFGIHWPKPFKRRSVLQFSLTWDNNPSWPYIQTTMGGGGLFGIIVWIYKFGFDLDFMSYTWKFDFLPGTSK